MTDPHDERATIGWYRTELPRDVKLELCKRSDLQGFLQAGGYLALWCCTGAITLWCAFTGRWLAVPFFLLLHGTVGSFNINGVHELCHYTVFKTKRLNDLFCRLIGFFGWNDWVWFNASHANHHRYTLHPPRDGEVVLPAAYAGVTRKNFWKYSLWNPKAPYDQYKGTLDKARGKLEGDWTLALFPESKPDLRRRLVNWNRAVITGHSILLLGSIVTAIASRQWTWLLVPYVVSHSSTYGGWLLFLCNNTQHIGLTDKVPDFRVSCRSVKLPWIASFLYWRMEYHIEHHMYAAVPCYNLPKLQKLVAHDLPERKGLFAAWKEINVILKRQKENPGYQFVDALPDTAHPPVMGNREHEVAAGAVPADPDASCDEFNAESPSEVAV
ncbi:MAG: fatty acid desaturase [Verrucomicrobia bacterium]|nr:fatty acid desaturase [Verrucomicrobiota bacterium]MDA1086551.1 fatty acid desaturase [Verrucomicrobiota bacterium]